MSAQTDFFLNRLLEHHLRETYTDGIQAMIRLYYLDNTDCVAVEPDLLSALEILWYYAAMTKPVEEIIESVEAEINAEGGVVSMSNGKRHRVRTYMEDE